MNFRSMAFGLRGLVTDPNLVISTEQTPPTSAAAKEGLDRKAFLPVVNSETIAPTSAAAKELVPKRSPPAVNMERTHRTSAAVKELDLSLESLVLMATDLAPIPPSKPVSTTMGVMRL
jgi:hypothetical protein